MANVKKFKVIVERFYHVSDTIEVEAENENEALDAAREISNSKDYKNLLELENMFSFIDEDFENEGFPFKEK